MKRGWEAVDGDGGRRKENKSDSRGEVVESEKRVGGSRW